MSYEGTIYRPPSEADAYILQATIGCSWNACTYCGMYREKTFRVRESAELEREVEEVGRALGPRVRKVFVADGDPLVMPLAQWERLLVACRGAFPALARVSTYATAQNILNKSVEELRRLRELGLELLYVGPESGDDVTLGRIAKGATFDEHQRAAERAHEAKMTLSLIFLLGVGGVARSLEHARASARLVTACNPAYVAALTLTVLEATPLGARARRGKFALPDVNGLLTELRILVDEARPTEALFRTNHASNYLPLGGTLPGDRERILRVIDAALSGALPLRPEFTRGL